MAGYQHSEKSSRSLRKRFQILILSQQIFIMTVDTHYPRRPQESEDTHLYDFARMYDIVSSRPVSATAQYYELSSSKFLKKRERPYLLNHYMYDVNKFPEKYYFGILLMFKPWRNLAGLKAGQKHVHRGF